ncbi:type I restriction endonuclease [Methanobrevibacter sp.]|uniref:type I restriction endonuclease n=1 Tax=Methanobrevibacter sp. TaxID=66852 RepID=UPI003867D64E
MTFEEKIKDYVKSIPNKIKFIDSEETTKIALITPFLRELGYDTSDPSVVRAEYTADVGTKQGEKVDFAILDDGEPVIFIECKSVQNDLNEAHISQLYRYFSITDVQLGILTNGVDYRFYTTGDDNRMDDKPFLEIDLLNLSKKDIKELEKFVNGAFDVNEAVNRADDLKYRNLIKKTLIKEFESPSDEFVRVIGKQVYDGVLTQSLKERFGKIIVSVNTEFINERVQKRLADAVQTNEVETAKDEAKEEESMSPETIITTDIEKEGYFIVRSIASEHNHENFIHIRDQKQYCNILFDDNKYYPIIRFYFNNDKRLKIELFDEIKRTSNGGKIGDKHNIEQVSDIYNFKSRILALIDKYVEEKSK